MSIALFVFDLIGQLIVWAPDVVRTVVAIHNATDLTPEARAAKLAAARQQYAADDARVDAVVPPKP